MTNVPSRVLVTGGAGFIGSHLVDALVAQGAERIVVVDNFFLGAERNLQEACAAHPDRIVVHREDAGDLTAMAEILGRESIDVVFNLATKALMYSFANPPGACRVNLDIALTLCELLRGGAFARLVHLSSSEVYGTARTVPMDEHHPLEAETTYAAGKAAADLAVASYVRMFDLDITTLRPFNNYGPRQNDSAFAAIVPITIRRILGGAAPYVTGDGLQTRDFIFVGDTADAIVRASAEGGQGQVFNLGSGRETSMLELVGALARLLDCELPVEHRDARVADVRRHCADVTAAEAWLGPIAATSLDDGLRTTVDWYRSHAPR